MEILDENQSQQEAARFLELAQKLAEYMLCMNNTPFAAELIQLDDGTMTPEPPLGSKALRTIKTRQFGTIGNMLRSTGAMLLERAAAIEAGEKDLDFEMQRGRVNLGMRNYVPFPTAIVAGAFMNRVFNQAGLAEKVMDTPESELAEGDAESARTGRYDRAKPLTDAEIDELVDFIRDHYPDFKPNPSDLGMLGAAFEGMLKHFGFSAAPSAAHLLR